MEQQLNIDPSPFNFMLDEIKNSPNIDQTLRKQVKKLVFVKNFVVDYKM